MLELRAVPEVLGHDPAVVGALAAAADEPDEAHLRALVDRADRRARHVGVVGSIECFAAPVTTEEEQMLDAAGFTCHRELLQLRRSLPLPPNDTERPATRSFRPSSDVDAWLEVNNRAFAWHPEQGGWDEQTLTRHLATGWFDAEGFLVHEREGTIVGFCWTKVHPSTETDPALGEIFVIGVDPSVQGTGLGRALVQAGLDHLAGRGLHHAMLYVEADNTAALRLYGGLGFDVHERHRWYTRPVGR